MELLGENAEIHRIQSTTQRVEWIFRQTFFFCIFYTNLFCFGSMKMEIKWNIWISFFLFRFVFMYLCEQYSNHNNTHSLDVHSSKNYPKVHPSDSLISHFHLLQWSLLHWELKYGVKNVHSNFECLLRVKFFVWLSGFCVLWYFFHEVFCGMKWRALVIWGN